MGRWDIDDAARSPDRAPTSTAERTDTTRRDHDPQITPLPDRVSPRTRDGLDDGRGHSLTLPAGQEREAVRDHGRTYHLRGSEVDLLERTGQFRVTFTEDLKHEAGTTQFGEDLRSLKEQGLVAERTVTRLREGAVADVVSVTPAGGRPPQGPLDPEEG